MVATFIDATAVQALGTHHYSAFFDQDWCVGSVPHGGFITSCFLSVAKLHFDTTRRSYRQPHTIAIQLQFLRRSVTGPAKFTVSDSKLGTRISTIHISLTQGQGDPDQHPAVVGYITQSNLTTEAGLSLETAFSLHPPPLPIQSTDALRRDEEPNWVLTEKKFTKFRKAGRHVKTYLLREGQVGQALIDQWLCFESGERFTQEALGYLVDTFPQIMESANGQGDLAKEMRQLQAQNAGASDVQESGPIGTGLDKSQWAQFWYPTVTLTIDIKKALPVEGVDWLFSRVRAKQIRNGRMDLEVTILNEDGDILALSTHVALIVDAKRNMVRNANSVSKIPYNASSNL